MKPPIPLHDARFVYIPSANHDADSTKFRERQRARIAEADAERKAATNVRTINRGKKI